MKVWKNSYKTARDILCGLQTELDECLANSIDQGGADVQWGDHIYSQRSLLTLMESGILLKGVNELLRRELSLKRWMYKQRMHEVLTSSEGFNYAIGIVNKLPSKYPGIKTLPAVHRVILDARQSVEIFL